MPGPSDLPAHVARNRASWDADAAAWAEPGGRAWAQTEPDWGIWHVPEREVGAVPAVDGKDVVELGCGTAYWSAWLARRGAQVVGIDNSDRQLETARALQVEHGLEFPLLHGNAETVPSRPRSRGRSSRCIASSGRTTTRSSSTCRTAR